MYIYNPSEPAGVPVQPGPDIREPYVFNSTSIFTLGRCGNCAACPKVWHLNVPLGFGEPYFAGDWYLKRNPYFYGNDTRYPFENCSWESENIWGSYCPINGANPLKDDLFADTSGWVLSFHFDSSLQGFNWYLRSPIYVGPSDDVYCSVWQFALPLLEWRCLQANTFLYAARVAEFDWPYVVDALVLTPFYG